MGFGGATIDSSSSATKIWKFNSESMFMQGMSWVIWTGILYIIVCRGYIQAFLEVEMGVERGTEVA